MKKKMLSAIAGLAMAGLFIIPSIAAGPLAGHPNLQAARHAIEQALAACKRAHAGKQTGEFGGHRDKAEQLLEQANQELDAAAEYANSHRKGPR